MRLRPKGKMRYKVYPVLELFLCYRDWSLQALLSAREYGVNELKSQSRSGSLNSSQTQVVYYKKHSQQSRAVSASSVAGYYRYYNKYIDVKKGSIAGINMVLAAYVVFNYCLSYKELSECLLDYLASSFP